MPSRGDDPGQASERTLLAWQRTTLLFGALAGVALVASAHHDDFALGAPAALILAAIGLRLRSHARHAYLARRRGEPHRADPAGAALVTGGTLVAALLLAALVAAGR